MKKLADFTGGLNTRFSEQLIQDNQGVIYTNIDNSKGALTPVQDKLALDPEVNVKLWFTYFFEDEEWISFDTPHDFIEFQGVLYYTDRVGDLKRYKDGEETLASLKKLDEAPSLELFNELSTTDSFDFRYERVVDDEALYNKTYTYMLLDYRLDEINTGDLIYSNPYTFTAFKVITGDVGLFDPDYRPLTSYFDPEADANEQIENYYRYKHVFSGFNGLVDTDGTVGNDEAREGWNLFRYYEEGWFLVGASSYPNFLDIEDLKHNLKETYNYPLDESLITPFFGVYQYVITAYNENTFTESAPSPLSEELEAESGTIRVTINVTQEELDNKYQDATHWRIYRIGGNITAFRTVAEIPITQTVFDDRVKDQDLGDFLVTQTNGAAPLGLKYIVESYAMLFGADGNRLRYTDIGDPTNWSELFYIEFDSDITGLAPVSNGLLVFTRRKTHLVTGTSPSSLVTQLLSTDRGCISHDSISSASKGTVIWASSDTLCASNGGEIVSLTKDFLGTYEIQEIIRATTHKEIYYLQLLDGRILCWDYGYSNRIPYFLELNSNNILSVGFDLILRSDVGLLHKAFKSQDKLELHYKSPKLTDGNYSVLKTYNKIYVLANLNYVITQSEFNITLELLQSTVVLKQRLITGRKFQCIYVPQEYQQAYSIQFEIKTKGIVEEIIYLSENSLGQHYAE